MRKALAAALTMVVLLSLLNLAFGEPRNILWAAPLGGLIGFVASWFIWNRDPQGT